MEIKGLQKITLLDFPSKVACTVFTGGCNFRCPFCHNASLVIRPDAASSFDIEEFFAYIQKRKGVLDGVCITGGEPLLHKDIIPFMERIRSCGLLIKLDTNGSFPTLLAEIIERGLVDYIAMDIKNSEEKYAATCGIHRFPEGVSESIDLIMSSGVDYEFRTTVVDELHTVEDIAKIAERIRGAKRYFLQGFTDSGDLILSGFSPCSIEKMQDMLAAAKHAVPSTELRGV